MNITSFGIGIDCLLEEVQNLETGRVFWVNADTLETAQRLVGSTIRQQAPTAEVSLIFSKDDPRTWLSLDSGKGPKEIRLAHFVRTSEGMDAFFDEMSCIQSLANTFLIVLVSLDEWVREAADGIERRVARLVDGCLKNDCALLVITYGKRLMLGTGLDGRLNIWLSGMADLQHESDTFRYQVGYWSNRLGVSASEAFCLEWDAGPGIFVNKQKEAQRPQPVQDSSLIVACSNALENLPVLSEEWQLMPLNKDVYERAQSLQRATVIFCLENIAQIDEILTYVHSLRQNRGSGLRLIIREMHKPLLRLMDEACFAQCGISAIVPWSMTLTKFLVQLRAVQAQTMSYPPLRDIVEILQNRKLLNVRGYQSIYLFCEMVQRILDMPFGNRNEKGLFLMLQPVSSLSVAQVLSICRIRRDGDIVTTWEGSIVLFLSFCCMSEVDTVLDRLFGLPSQDIFLERKIFYSDDSIRSALENMYSAVMLTGEPATVAYELPQPVFKHDAPTRIRPYPVVLFQNGDETGPC